MSTANCRACFSIQAHIYCYCLSVIIRLQNICSDKVAHKYLWVVLQQQQQPQPTPITDTLLVRKKKTIFDNGMGILFKRLLWSISEMVENKCAEWRLTSRVGADTGPNIKSVAVEFVFYRPTNRSKMQNTNNEWKMCEIINVETNLCLNLLYSELTFLFQTKNQFLNKVMRT